jgi:multicomponent Na+:H+ antiporter subunit E
MVRYALILLIVLIVYWFSLSGYFDHTVLYVTGGLSVLAVVALTIRMKILDEETVPYYHVKSLAYYVWLFKEIFKANIAVVKAVLSPDLEISPTLVEIPMGHKTDLGRTIFANSITLTPGTISVELDEDKILVHALLQEMTDLEGFKEMGERSAWSINDPMTKAQGAETGTPSKTSAAKKS